MDWGSIFGIALFRSGLAFAMPTALAAVGETVSERAGVLNLGLEGMMLSGALAGFLGDYWTGSVVVGVLAGVGCGIALATITAALSVVLKTEQVINGIALVIFAQGMSQFVYEQLFGQGSRAPIVQPLPDIRIPGLGSIPGLGPVLFDQNALFYLSAALSLSVWLLVYRTRFGLTLRAVGEAPAAADAAGLHVDRVRWMALLFCGAMAGLGGMVLSVGDLSLFTANVTAGRGWVAIALVIFGRWNPLFVLGGALLFGLTDALQIQIRATSGGINASIPYEAFQALPYLLTIVVMVVVTIRSRRDAQPAALGVPFLKEVQD